MKGNARLIQHLFVRHGLRDRDGNGERALLRSDREGDAPRSVSPLFGDRAFDLRKGDLRVCHLSSSIGLRTSDGRPRGSGVHWTLRPALVALLPLSLAACEADAIAARATLKDLGFHGIAVERAPVFGRPCGWGEPFAVRFRATREDGSAVAGTLCSADEATEDARLLPDAEGRR